MTLGLGLGLAIGSAVALNWGYFAQHAASSSLPRLEPRRPLRSMRLLLGSGRWLVGFLVGIGGWGLYVGALELAPLSLVQASSAGGIGVLALLIHLRSKSERLDVRDWTAVGIAVGGLSLLGVSLTASHASGASPSASAVGAWLIGSALVAGAAAASIGLVLPAAGLGATAGILYAVGDVATKAAVDSVSLLFVPVVFLAHGLAFVSLQLGFQRGSALVSIGVATLLTNALPIAAGSMLFHEPIPAGVLGDCRIAAFALVTTSAALLIRPQLLPAERRSR